MNNYTHIFHGTAFTSQTPMDINVLENYIFCINENGMIEKIISPTDSIYESFITAHQNQENFHRLREGQFFLPGFIDLHIHAAQWAQAGTALDLPLYDWLSKYTFPVEAKFADIQFAQEVYEQVVQQLIANGTTTALYFATVHKEASILLAKICAEKGQRGLVGKVVMDDTSQNPEFYRDETTEHALADTEDFILRVKELAKGVKQGVYPVVTPRFIPSCTDQALQGLGELAAKHDTYIQSHCSESDWAHNHVKDRFGKNDAFALHDFGLLQEKSVMAHCNFLEENDQNLFKETGTAIAHCPISNAYFANSALPLKAFSEKGIEIGLGSDISGGFSPSLYDNIRQSVITSRMLEDGVDASLAAEKRGVENSQITINEAFYFATAGGGESLSLPIGKIEENYTWDVQIIDTKHAGLPLPIFGDEPLMDTFQKILYLTRPEHIREVWIQGERVLHK